MAEDKNSNHFKISVNAGFDYSSSKLSSSSSIITDSYGEIQSDQAVDKEGLANLNDANSYKLEQQSIDIRAEYYFMNRLSLWVGLGVTTTSMRNSYSAEDRLHTKSASENPTFLLKGGLSYQYDFTDGWFVRITPHIAWNRSDNNMMSFAQNEESEVYHTYDLKRSIFRWEVPVVAGCKLNRWTPYIGAAYRDYSISDKFRSYVSFVGQDYPIEIHDKYKAKTKIAGIVGCSFDIYENLGVNLNCTFSRDIAGVLSLYFTI